MEYIFKTAAKELFNVAVNTVELKMVKRSPDFQETSLEVILSLLLSLRAVGEWPSGPSVCACLWISFYSECAQTNQTEKD